jgi:hypothetical protein
MQTNVIQSGISEFLRRAWWFVLGIEHACVESNSKSIALSWAIIICI